MRILSIETSCDETGLAIVRGSGNAKNPKIEVVKEVLASQIKIHAPWGGVVPNLAKREHQKNLPLLLNKLLMFPVIPAPRRYSGQAPAGIQVVKKYAGFRLKAGMTKDIDAIAVTVGPGLEPALWAGIEFAKQLAKNWKKPLLGVNHMEGHLYSVLLDQNAVIFNSQFSISKLFPAIALIVSGGHTILLKMDSLLKWKKLGETRDDAAGEAFDKVARLLDLPYPGGPEISKIARNGNPLAIPFPQPMRDSKNYDFSFSGLKTAVLYYLRNNYPSYVVPGPFSHSEAHSVITAKAGIQHQKHGSQLGGHNYAWKTDVAASFEYAVVQVLTHKTFRAVKECDAKSVWLAGGVAANKALRKVLGERCKVLEIPLLVAKKKHDTDNAAMIGAAAYMDVLREKKRPIRARGDFSI